MKLSAVISKLEEQLRVEGDFDLTPEAEANFIEKSINPQYYIDQALAELAAVEAMIGVAPAKDYVREYGVLVGKSRVRHFIDKSAGGKVTLCGLECVFVEGASIEAERTCAKCADAQAALRSK